MDGSAEEVARALPEWLVTLFQRMAARHEEEGHPAVAAFLRGDSDLTKLSLEELVGLGNTMLTIASFAADHDDEVATGFAEGVRRRMRDEYAIRREMN